MTTRITTTEQPPTSAMTRRGDQSVDAPANDELVRARDLADYFAKRLGQAERFGDAQVKLDIESARELCQMLHDSIRTADQLQNQPLTG